MCWLVSPPVFYQFQDHHQGESYCEENGSDIGMFSGGHFGDEFFYYYVEHGSGGEA